MGLSFIIYIMKWIQLFELKDFSWFTDLIRSPMTRLLQVMNHWLGLNEAIAFSQ